MTRADLAFGILFVVAVAFMVAAHYYRAKYTATRATLARFERAWWDGRDPVTRDDRQAIEWVRTFRADHSVSRTLLPILDRYLPRRDDGKR